MRIYRDHHLAHQALLDELLELQCGLALRRRISDHMAELDLDRFRLRGRDGHDEAKRGEAAEKNAHVRFPPVHPALLILPVLLPGSAVSGPFALTIPARRVARKISLTLRPPG